jgi:hypothetical protein
MQTAGAPMLPFSFISKKIRNDCGRKRPSGRTVRRKADDIRVDLFLHAAACCTKDKIILGQSFEFLIQDSIKKIFSKCNGFQI